MTCEPTTKPSMELQITNYKSFFFAVIDEIKKKKKKGSGLSEKANQAK